MAQPKDEVSVTWINYENAEKLHASQAARALGLTRDVFLRRWRTGELAELFEDPQDPDLLRWAVLMSLGRENTPGSR